MDMSCSNENNRRGLVLSGVPAVTSIVLAPGRAGTFPNKISDKYDDRPKRRGPKPKYDDRPIHR